MQSPVQPSAAVLDATCRQFGLKGPLRFVRKVENWIYRAEGEDCFVRLTDPDHRSQAQLESELDWVDHLKKAGLGVAGPLPDRTGAWVARIEGDSSPYLASVFERAPGETLRNPADFTPKIVCAWGETLGQLHATTQTYQPQSVAHRPQWNQDRNHREMIARGRPSDGGIYRGVRSLVEQWEGLEQTPGTYALVHADLHQGNFHVGNGKITVFDFDDCLYHWFAYDIGVVFYYADPASTGMSRAEFEEHFWRGYETRHTLPASHRKLVPDFEKYRGALVYYWCQRHLTDPSLSGEARRWMSKKVRWCEETFR